MHKRSLSPPQTSKAQTPLCGSVPSLQNLRCGKNIMSQDLHVVNVNLVEEDEIFQVSIPENACIKDLKAVIHAMKPQFKPSIQNIYDIHGVLFKV